MNFQKMSRKTVFTLLWVCTIVLSGSVCSKSQGSNPNRENDANKRSKVQATNSNAYEKEQGIIVETASMKFWWWTEEDVRLGVYRDDPPVKSRYLELTKWRYDGDKIATSPHEIDLIGEFANPGPDEFSGKVIFRLSGKYEDYENLYSEELTIYEVTSGRDIFKDLAWKNEKSVYETNLIVAAGGHRTVKFPNYDLTGFLNSKFDGKPLAALRLEVEVKSVAGETLSKKQIAVPVILGD
ncbi:MAG: hypothetical protein KIS76_01855 [Pyrinomonadaceae bacterium]|nr:hypothetical protein [Pyrinomonadaceae bacterium]